jgi:hypothetical protein
VPVGLRLNLRHELPCARHCKPFLSYTTQRAYVTTGALAGKAFTEHQTYFINLTDTSGRWIGVLSSNGTDASQLFPAERCELIIVSEARVQGKSLDSSFLEIRTVLALERVKVYEF